MSAKFARAQKNFAKSLAGQTHLTIHSQHAHPPPGYSVVTYLLQIQDRHNGTHSFKFLMGPHQAGYQSILSFVRQHGQEDSHAWLYCKRVSDGALRIYLGQLPPKSQHFHQQFQQ